MDKYSKYPQPSGYIEQDLYAMRNGKKRKQTGSAKRRNNQVKSVSDDHKNVKEARRKIDPRSVTRKKERYLFERDVDELMEIALNEIDASMQQNRWNIFSARNSDLEAKLKYDLTQMIIQLEAMKNVDRSFITIFNSTPEEDGPINESTMQSRSCPRFASNLSRATERNIKIKTATPIQKRVGLKRNRRHSTDFYPEELVEYSQKSDAVDHQAEELFFQPEFDDFSDCVNDNYSYSDTLLSFTDDHDEEMTHLLENELYYHSLESELSRSCPAPDPIDMLVGARDRK
eukprot:TRINITY_DN2721_c0_g1_i1.p1 TRINITY_DN2721_c0_g1~~TRINITY_DN2721_c0_g1_i1.p1  ORF type:complete len:287 (+),score=88.13 TRINITY_DN2721_c0_g1_i1:70-930(+)